MSNTMTDKQLINFEKLVDNINAIETPPKMTVLGALIDSVAVRRKYLRFNNSHDQNRQYMAELTALRHLRTFLTCKF